jgi:TM2 domain-containing membrane protein YozV
MSKDARRKKWLTILVAWTIGYWLIVFILSLLAGSDLLFWGTAVASYILGLVLSVYNLKERKTTKREVPTPPQ